MNIRELLIKIGVDAKGAPEALDRVDNRADKLKSTFSGLNIAFLAISAAAATSVKSLFSVGDSMQSLQARIGASTGDIAGANAQLNDLAAHASASRMDVETYADSWAKFANGMQRLGYQTSDTTQLVDGLSAAFAVNGTTGSTAAGALFQLTQSISGGSVQMEELNSLMDAAGPLYVSIAEDIGGTTTAFKKMVSQGKVSSKQLADSIIKQTAKYIDQLREMPMTLGNVWTLMLNDVKTGINNLNSSASVIPRMAKKLSDAWTLLTTKAHVLIDALGGPEGLTDQFKFMVQPIIAVAGAFALFKALTWLTTPIGMITLLGIAISALWADYQGWKNGADSFIDWAKWQPAITGATDSVKELAAQFKGLGEQIAAVLGIDLKNWSLGKEIKGLTQDMGDLRDMLSSVAKLVTALKNGDWKAAAGAGAALLNQPGRVPEQQQTYVPDTVKRIGNIVKQPFVALDNLVAPWLGLPQHGQQAQPASAGAGAWPALTTAANGSPLRTTPPRAGNQTVTQNVTNNQTFNVTQQPGEDGKAFASRVAAMGKAPIPAGGYNLDTLLDDVNGATK